MLRIRGGLREMRKDVAVRCFANLAALVALHCRQNRTGKRALRDPYTNRPRRQSHHSGRNGEETPRESTGCQPESLARD